MKFTLTIATILISFIACNKENPTIKKIEVYYIPGIFESPISNCCDSATNTWYHNGDHVDTTISDPVILRMINNEIQNLKLVDTIYPVDGRISCTVYYSNDSITTLCMGSLIGTIYNQKQVADNLDLNYLIKKHSGYYYYIPFQLVLEMTEISTNPQRQSEIKSEDTNYFKLGELPISEDSLVEIRPVRRRRF